MKRGKKRKKDGKKKGKWRRKRVKKKRKHTTKENAIITSNVDGKCVGIGEFNMEYSISCECEGTILDNLLNSNNNNKL
jgi:hypothetical protein